ncbi:MAG: peptide chain release factor N(5)-glutamine methyltransferase [Deltaproteobacteria bacterium]|jgi:release factor glutamine methyltransferase|nr:peptide chain release factor N(5)-glutamine methyltransferase [Deltaproteobacteria bacterium]
MLLSLDAFLRKERALFQRAGVEAPHLCAELLLAHALGLTRPALLQRAILTPHSSLSHADLRAYTSLRARRLRGEPVAYILGQKEFYGRPFKVNAATLIPRPETELVVETAKQHFAGRRQGVFADFGTGSGCLAVTLALELGRDWRGLALDISPPALAVAANNAQNLGAAEKLLFILADYAAPPLAQASLDLMAANPPYISLDEFHKLHPGVRCFEPANALLAGPQGTEHLLLLAALAVEMLKPGGLLLMETGYSQGRSLRATLRPQDWTETLILRDLAGLDRLLLARRGGG